MAEWYGTGDVWVNSYHHQGVKELASPFRPMAHAAEGLIEGFYDPSHPFRIGLQFHPEGMQADYPGRIRVFKSYLSAVEDYANRD